MLKENVNFLKNNSYYLPRNRISFIPKQQYKKSVFNYILIYENIISQLNNNFPIAKTLLEYFIKLCYQNKDRYCNFISWKTISQLITKDTFISNKLKQKILKQISLLTSNLLFLYIDGNNKDEWYIQLKKLFNNYKEIADQLFDEFNNQTGNSNYNKEYSIMIINRNKVKQIKDIQEIIQHQFVHIFQQAIKISNKKIKLNKISYNDKIIFDSNNI